MAMTEDINRIAREISKAVTGRQYHELDSMRDFDLIATVCRKANIVRYIRMGIDLNKRFSAQEIEECRKLAGEKLGYAAEQIPLEGSVRDGKAIG